MLVQHSALEAGSLGDWSYGLWLTVHSARFSTELCCGLGGYVPNQALGMEFIVVLTGDGSEKQSRTPFMSCRII